VANGGCSAALLSRRLDAVQHPKEDDVVAIGLDQETLEFTLESIGEFARRELPDNLLIELDDRDEFPAEIVRKMCSDELGIQLLFVEEQYGRPRPGHLGARHFPWL
jgi:hypothetical protein